MAIITDPANLGNMANVTFEEPYDWVAAGRARWFTLFFGGSTDVQSGTKVDGYVTSVNTGMQSGGMMETTATLHVRNWRGIHPGDLISVDGSKMQVQSVDSDGTIELLAYGGINMDAITKSNPVITLQDRTTL